MKLDGQVTDDRVHLSAATVGVQSTMNCWDTVFHIHADKCNSRLNLREVFKRRATRIDLLSAPL